MTFHLAGWYQSVDPGGVGVEIDALADARLFTQGKYVRVPSLNQVAFVAASISATSPGGAEMKSPTLDRYAPYPIVPVNLAGAGLPNSPLPYDDLRMGPLVLGVDELVSAEVSSNPSSAEPHWCLVAFSDGAAQQISPAQTFSVSGKCTGSVSAGSWTLLAWTPESNLPPGQYAIVGMHALATNLIAARVVLRTGPDQWRPGCIAAAAANAISPELFRDGGLGQWGTFPFQQLPAMEFLSSGNVSDPVVTLDLVPL